MRSRSLAAGVLAFSLSCRGSPTRVEDLPRHPAALRFVPLDSDPLPAPPPSEASSEMLRDGTAALEELAAHPPTPAELPVDQMLEWMSAGDLPWDRERRRVATRADRRFGLGEVPDRDLAIAHAIVARIEESRAFDWTVIRGSECEIDPSECKRRQDAWWSAAAPRLERADRLYRRCEAEAHDAARSGEAEMIAWEAHCRRRVSMILWLSAGHRARR